MKLTVLGATGSVGREIVSQALTAGHAVTTLVRTPTKLGDLQSRVIVVQGDVTDAATMARAVAGADAVLSAVGHTRGGADDVIAKAIGNAITAMRQANVRRIIALANTAVPDVRDQPTGGQRFQGALMGMMMGKLNQDHVTEAQLLAKSGLDWTLVRAPLLADGPRTGAYRVGALDKTTGGSIARADVADFMLACVVKGQHIGEAPVVSK